MSTPRALRMLYREIPATSACVPGRMACCGPVPWTEAEMTSVARDIPPTAEITAVAGVTTLRDRASGMCAFASSEGCRVYDRRPFMCRLFGATKGAPQMTCPHGVHAERPLSAGQAHHLTRRYIEEMPA